MVGCSLPRWLATDSPDATFVGRDTINGRGSADLYVQHRKRDFCLRLVRRWDRETRTDRWRSCGFLPNRAGLDVHTRISCKAGELHYLGVTPRATKRLVGRLSDGRRLSVKPWAARGRPRTRGKLVMVVVRLPRELGGLFRAVDRRGRTIDSTIVHLIRGVRCGQPRPAKTEPLLPER